MAYNPNKFLYVSCFFLNIKFLNNWTHIIILNLNKKKWLNSLDNNKTRFVINMTYLLAIQKIKDYDKWKPIFDEHGDDRKEMGSMGATVLRSTRDPNELVIITEWENIDAAKKFASSKNLKTSMKRAGVIGLPELHYLEEIEKTEY